LRRPFGYAAGVGRFCCGEAEASVYKYLLCWRLLFGRRSSLVCVVSVLLGVATLVLVNAVMAGFSATVRERMQGTLSDVAIEATSLEGFADAPQKLARIHGDGRLSGCIAAMGVVLESPGLLQYQTAEGEAWKVVPVRAIGCDLPEYVRLGSLHQRLVRQRGAQEPSFATPVGDRGIILSRAMDGVPDRGAMVALGVVRGPHLKLVREWFTVADHFDSPSAALDGHVTIVPLARLQEMRDLPGRVTGLRLKLTDYPRQRDRVKPALQALFSVGAAHVKTWEDQQQALLQAMAWEKSILNVMLFLVLCVAAFSILAVFCLLVTEQQTTIGVLKALGASDRGVLLIFLSYGSLLGLIGAALGAIAGTALSEHINDVARFLARLTGTDTPGLRPYLWTHHFDRIPTRLCPMHVWLIGGLAVALAALFSALPSWRGAKVAAAAALRNR
jgi:lipoprotein-releasing system permease protein